MIKSDEQGANNQRELHDSGNRQAQRQAEEKLAEGETRYRSLFENMINGCAYCQMLFENDQPQDFIFLEVNPYFEKLSGLQNVVGKKISELMPDLRGSNPEMFEIYGRVALTGTPEKADIHVPALGSWFSLAVYSTKPGTFVSVFDNITERKSAEEAQQASELRYRRLFESAKDGILILDAKTGRVIDANPFIVDLLGLAHDELAGKELWEIDVLRDIAPTREAFAELQNEGNVRYDDLPLRTRHGRLIEVEFASNAYQVGDSQVIQCSIRDTTERKLGKGTLERTNRKLQATLGELSATTQQLWQASKLATMGELSASIAHELNNPLATVALRTESLLMQLPEDDQKRRGLEIIAQEVDRMATLVRDLLQFSRRGHRQVSTVDVGEEIVNSVQFVHYHLRSRKVEVVCDFADSLPTIQADRQQLRQLFLNLLTNAGDAMPQGGRLTISAAATFMEDAQAVQLDFADTGEGISVANLEKIWEPFFTTKPEGKGTGLGLAICRRIVEEHGGTIDLESDPGQGAIVHIVFPATSQPNAPDFVLTAT